MPARCRRISSSVVKVNDHLDKYEVVGAHLHIDDDAPELTYTARVSTALFDPGLVTAIAARLAWRLCYALTDNANAAESLPEALCRRAG
jgi:hypothetical protein